MKPAPVDLPIIWRNCDWEIITLKWKKPDGTKMDLTGWVPVAHTAQFSLNARISGDPKDGVCVMSLDRLVTATIKLGVYQWNWIFANVDGTVPPPFLAGNVEVKNPILFTG